MNVARMAVFLLLGTILVGCRPPEEAADVGPQAAPEGNPAATVQRGELSVRTELSGEPRLGEAEVLVYLLEHGEGVSGAEVSVTGDMTHAGMVPVVSDAPEVEPGLYRSEDFEFTMAGDWIITTEVVLEDGSRHMGELSVTVPGD